MHSLVQDLSDGVRLIQLMVRPTLVPCFAVSLFTPSHLNRRSWVTVTHPLDDVGAQVTFRRYLARKIQQKSENARSESREREQGVGVHQTAGHQTDQHWS